MNPVPATCCQHLPGNRTCPYAPLYVVTWVHHAPEPHRRNLHRPVCALHLVPAIDDALEDSPRSVAAVEVALWEATG